MKRREDDCQDGKAARYGGGALSIVAEPAPLARMVASDPTDARQVLTVAANVLQDVVSRTHGNGDHAATIRALDVWTRITGARAPDRLEVDAKRDEYDAMTTPERVTWLRETVRKLTLALAAEEAKLAKGER